MGAAPHIEDIDKQTCEETRDWGAEAAPMDVAGTPLQPAGLQEDPQVQAVVLKYWDLFEKQADSSVGRQEYEMLVRRMVRVLIPALTEAQELRLAASSWRDAVSTSDRLTFERFFQDLVRFAKVWSDSRSTDVLREFLEDMLARITCVLIPGEDGKEVEVPVEVVVNFYGQNGNYDWSPPTSDLVKSLDISFVGRPPRYQLQAKINAKVFTETGCNYCWYTETARIALGDLFPEEPVRRVWAALKDIAPLGYGVRAALEQVVKTAGEDAVQIDTSALRPPPETPLDGARTYLGNRLPSGGGTLAVVVDARSLEPEAKVDGAGRPFTITDLLGAGLAQGNVSKTVIIAAAQTCMLYKLERVRRALRLPETSALAAATRLGAAGNPMKLPSFDSILRNELEADPSNGLMKPVIAETLLESGSLAEIAEMHVATVAHDGDVGGRILRDPASPSSQSRHDLHLSSHLADFPTPEEGLRNDETDLLCLARTAPVTLWVLGKCSKVCAYKTEVCRRLADRMGLQWLSPAYVLELAVKTPEKYRTKLMKNCVEQLQRGMVVSIAASLALTLEIMSSVRCRTNGYVLDLPPLSSADEKVVTNFAQRVQTLSASREVRWDELFDEDLHELPPLKEEPKPPPPPKEEGEEGDAAAAAEPSAEVAEAEAPAAEDAEAPEAVEEGAVEGDSAEAPEGGEAQEEDLAAEAADASPPKPLAPLVPNPLVNLAPRRVVFLSMERDEIFEWRRGIIQQAHDEKERRRREREAAGEEPEEEAAEEEEEPLPPMPEEEEELQEVFDKCCGDLLAAMGPFVPLAPLTISEQLPKGKLPPLPDTTREVQEEVEDVLTYRTTEESSAEALRKGQNIPLLRIHADGRTPQTVADMLEVATGGFRGTKLRLPQPLEGAGDEPKELLRVGLEDKQASRRWSPWRLHCPVSLYEKSLRPGDKEAAAEYGGCVFVFKDLAARNRFCAAPKRFLEDAPRINETGMHLGYVLAGPLGYRCKELATRMQQVYGFDVVDLAEVIAQAMELEPSDLEVPLPEEGEEDPEAAATPLPQEDAGPELPRLKMAERQDLFEGRPLKAATLVRLVADSLKVGKNIELIHQQRAAVEEAKQRIAAAEAEGQEKPEDIVLNDDGEPVVELAEALRKPERGFVLINFPQTAEELQMIQDEARLAIERVLVMKFLGDEAPEPVEFFSKQGYDEHMPLALTLEAQLASLDGLQGVEGVQFEEVPIDATEEEQLVHIRKLIDPFYPVVIDPAAAGDIPDPDEWDEEAAIAAATDEEGKIAEKPVRPVVPWGACGPYCPVTLKKDEWLFPGSKEFQHTFGNKVFALADEKCSEAFVAEPVRYVPIDREPTMPPPRVLVTGPTGSTVARQCQLLSEVYHIPVMRLEEAWRKVVHERLEEAKKAKKAREKQEAEAERVLLGDDGEPVWLPGWVPKEEKPEGEEGEEEEEEPPAAEEDPEPEDDGLDDEQRAELFVDAMRTVLGRHCGACIIDGSFFGDLEDEEMGDDVRATRSLHTLLLKARRVPDVTIILRCKNDLAFNNAHDAAAIDKEDEMLCELAKAQDAEALSEKIKECRLVSEDRKAAFQAFVEELQGTEEDGPPDPLPEAPEDLLQPEEKESERAKAKFVERKKLEQDALKEFAEKLTEARAAPARVAVDRGEEPAHKAVRWHCRPFMELRASLLTRHQVVKLSPNRAQDLLARGLAMPSIFRQADPMALDAPLFAGRDDALQFVAECRGRLYYPRGQTQLESFLERPQDFMHMPPPSRVSVHPAAAVIGPPLSGKSTLARELARRTGAVYIDLSEVVTQLCSWKTLPSALSEEIGQQLRAGGKISDALVVEALRYRLLSPDVLQRGWILDDFPLTEQQAKALDSAGIVPHRVFAIELSEADTFSRAETLGKKGTPNDDDYVQQEVTLQRSRLDAYDRNAPQVRVFYSLTYDNMRRVDGTKSPWAMYDHALREIASAVSQRLEYYRRSAQGFAVRVYGMCWSLIRTFESLSDWLRYCPVSLTLGNELVECSDPRYMAEYGRKLYWLRSEEYLRLFLDDPESFLVVPLPEHRPETLSMPERRTLKEAPQLESYCPVALVDRKELVKCSDLHLVRFMNRIYSFETRQAAEKFMGRPMRYVQRAKLPSKRPAIKGEHQASLLQALERGRKGRGFEPADMLTFMQASIAEQICQALVDSGEKRPLYPGKSAHESALLFMAKFLRAKNPLNTEMFAEKVRAELEEFLSDCALPKTLCDLSVRKQEMESEDTWTSTDNRVFKELCGRVDDIFKLAG